MGTQRIQSCDVCLQPGQPSCHCRETGLRLHAHLRQRFRPVHGTLLFKRDTSRLLRRHALAKPKLVTNGHQTQRQPHKQGRQQGQRPLSQLESARRRVTV